NPRTLAAITSSPAGVSSIRAGFSPISVCTRQVLFLRSGKDDEKAGFVEQEGMGFCL
ncbi:hypothetical protein BT69DRAFT_1275685, partial [Atractiella rhizophila]